MEPARLLGLIGTKHVSKRVLVEVGKKLGLRFYSDHLVGNVYFKARHGRHNLDRARVQFRLVESIEAQEPAIRSLIAELCS